MEKKRRLIYSDSVPLSRINELPDDLLVLILSKLTVKEAARTSVLSHKWETLWVYYSGSLNFDYVDATFSTHRRRLSIERPRFISWVNCVLNMLRGSTVNGFRVCFDLEANNGDDIEGWIKFAMEKTVSSFELDFSEFHGYNNNVVYRFPDKLLDCPSNLLKPFGSLTSLRFHCVDLSDEVIAYFVSNCQSLEHLSIKCAPSITYINATTALKLKRLEIEYCRRLKTVDISNTNIESLKFHGAWRTRSSLENLHLLTEVSLHDQWCTRVVRFGFWPLPFSQLQRLELYMVASVLIGNIKYPEVFPTLCNLKHLEVSLGAGYNQNIFCLTSLICASPLLSSFTLKVLYQEPSPYKHYHALPSCEWRKSEKRIHECLKVVQFFGWYGYESDVDLICYLIEKSVVLEKVIIDPKFRFTSKRSALHEPTEKVSRERANLLQKYAPPGMEFVIL